MEEDDWDLQAVVRSCFGQTTTAAAAARDAFSSFPPSLFGVEERVKEEKEEGDLIFPDLFSTQTVLEELEELCKPFFSKSPQKQHQRHKELSISLQRNPSSTSTTSFLPAVSGVQPRQPHQRPIPQTPRSKRRKNPQKRVVCQVPADGISSDMWAWRKYGQKPIKGSPYPRGYYRCSTLKGCLARKQVERSRTDPGMFVITYTAEHNHPRPTHRNSLAGSSRHKFPSSSSSQQVNEQGDSGALVENGREQPHKDASSPSPSPTAATGLSPTTSLTSSMEDEFLLPLQSGCKKEEEEEEEEDDNSLLVEDMEIMGDDDMLFLGLEELREPAADGFADQFSAAFSSHWAANSTTTAAGGC